MKPRRTQTKCSIFAFFSLLLSSCTPNQKTMVKVILEEGDYRCANPVLSLPKGSDFTFDLALDIDREIVSSSYANYTLTEELDNTTRFDKITFHRVNYSLVVSLEIKEAVKVTYSFDGSLKEEYVVKNHERINVSSDYKGFRKEGYCLVGWQNGEETVGLGSRTGVKPEVPLTAIYRKESDASLFEIREMDDYRVSIARYLGEEDVVVIPERIADKSVIALEKGAFEGLAIGELVLPPSLSSIKSEGISDCEIENLVFFDNLVEVDDASFQGSTIRHMRINAINDPAYIRSYFGTYAEKYDRLTMLKDKPKIVLYSGSSTRFGFDGELLDKGFPDREVVNMGVFAYTPSYPQVEVLSSFLKQGDIVVISPEFDAIEEQINLTPTLDGAFFAMIESNYDILLDLDVSEYGNLFQAYKDYQKNRSSLTRYSYKDTPYQYDEDGNRVASPSYNRYGDYVVYRPNNEKRTSFGVKRAFYNKTHFPEVYLERFSACFDGLGDKGARLFYDYSPRMNISLSEDSTPESITALGEYLESHIEMDFLSTINDSLMDPLYFYGTDNHLSTEGVAIRTKRVLAALSNR